MVENVWNCGEPVPWFVARTPMRPDFHFDTVAGRYIVMCFFGTAEEPASRRVLDDFRRHRERFDDVDLSFFGVSIDPADEQQARVREELPGIHFFWDFDRRISRLYRAVGPESADRPEGVPFRRFSLVLDERLRVCAAVPFEGPESHVARVLDALAALPNQEPAQPAPVPAPVLLLPRVFEPEFCRTLIQYYDERGGRESGFMSDVGGRTVLKFDHAHKRRRDQDIEDEAIRKACLSRIRDRLLPEIYKAFQFRATRIERYMVACYEAETGGHFRRHRDNTTRGTAHRRFAVSLNLNTGEYEGGRLCFPEFGRQTYAPPAGGAVVFSCSLLHEATPVTAGRRYAFLPFLYDDEAARIRQENLQFLDTPSTGGPPPK